jgi:SAM-dependent methyltransferase
MRGLKAEKSPEQIFTSYYEKNFWGNAESVSGPGSSLDETARVRALLPELCRELGIKTFLDVPCGDFAWMRHVPLEGVHYTGGDIVAPLIAQNQERFGNDRREFIHCDLIAGSLPRVDLVMCRDCLFHLSLDDAQAAIRRIKESGSTYLLATTHPGIEENLPMLTGGYRPVDLQLYPFAFPKPTRLVFERADAGFADTNKALGLWEIARLP